MGVHYLVRNLEHICGRLPFKITFDTENESDPNINEYMQIGKGDLKYIGIDGSVIIHSKIISENDNSVNIKKSTTQIVQTILHYVRITIIYFNIFNKKDETVQDKEIILHFVIDGKPPCNKNRRKILDEEGNETYKKDAYSLMPLDQKEKLHRKIIKYLNKELLFFNTSNNNKTGYKIKLLTNFNLNEKKRGEGEIQLYKVCQLLNKKFQHSSPLAKNVIISSDSDLISLMLLHQDNNLVVISPLSKNIYITNYKLVINALNLRKKNQVIEYVLLHFIFFGSDYNLGLMSNPNDSKQKVILNAVTQQIHNINDIGRNCIRKCRKRKYNDDDVESSPIDFLQKFKELLIYEAICAFMYYYDIENGLNYLTNYSPRLYEKFEAKKYISLLNF